MATSFIGKTISLLSLSDVRYRGELAGLDPVNSTIQLKDVYSMGTERRRPMEEYIPPTDAPYGYIIFKASEVKDLALDNEAPVRSHSVHDDPAVLAARPRPSEPEQQDELTDAHYQGNVPQNLSARPPPQAPSSQSAAPAGASVPSSNGVPAVPEQPQAQRAVIPDVTARGVGAGASAISPTSGVNRRANASVNSVHSATQSLENVERALGDLRLQNAQSMPSRGGTRRGGGGRDRNNNNNNNHSPITIPTTEFDFESSNARFKKTTGRKSSIANGSVDDDSDAKTNPSDEDDEEDGDSKTSSGKAKDDKTGTAYNPKSSFFDSLSSSAMSGDGAPRGGRGGARGGRGNGRSRREEERERNFATFGEAGGVGLMGPDAYVGGYGGYGRGRRGGRGGRGRGRARGQVLAGQ